MAPRVIDLRGRKLELADRTIDIAGVPRERGPSLDVAAKQKAASVLGARNLSDRPVDAVKSRGVEQANSGVNAQSMFDIYLSALSRKAAGNEEPRERGEYF